MSTSSSTDLTSLTDSSTKDTLGTGTYTTRFEEVESALVMLVVNRAAQQAQEINDPGIHVIADQTEAATIEAEIREEAEINAKQG